MTERSNFSATKGYRDAVNKAKPIVKSNQLTSTEKKSMPTVSSDKKKFKGFAGINSE